MSMGIDLSLTWAIIIFFGVMMYVVMDGFDLGIGILFPFAPDRFDRDVMMNTVAPVWDGNETWLVLGGAGLLAAFPLAYSVILSALYLPLVFMLLGLIFRGVAFEFRFKALEHERHLWDKAFIGGSLVAAFFQGVALGSYVSGIPMWGERYVGHALDWLAPFPLFTGLGLVVTYALLGRTADLCTVLLHRRDRNLDAGDARGDRGAMVLLAGFALACPDPDPRDAADGLPAAIASPPQTPRHAFRADARIDLHRLLRTRHQPVAQHHSAQHQLLGRGCAAAEPGLHTGRRVARDTDDPDVHGLVVLRVPRQGEAAGQRLPLRSHR
jgi:hypothetical protein